MGSKFTSYNDNFWACDFETTTKNTEFYKQTNETRVWLAYAKKFHPKGETQIDDEILTISIEEFFDEFWNRKESATLFFHNLNWDGEFIKWYLERNGFRYVYSDERKAQKGYRIFEDEKNIYFINIWKKVRSGNNKWKLVQLYIKCSLKLLVVGIESLAKIFKTQNKLSIHYDVNPFDKLEDVPQDLIDYIKVDVETMIQPLIQFNLMFSFKRGNKVLEGLAKLTIGSTCLSIFKNHCFKNKLKFKKDFFINFEDAEFLKNWYCGGLTTFNPAYQYEITNQINGKVYDVNSMYPSVMVDFKYPIGQPCFDKPIDETYDIEMLQIFIKKAQIKKDYYPPLIRPWVSATQKHTNGIRFVKYLENATAYYFAKELESLKRFYDIEYTIIKKVYFKSAWYFRDFITPFYNQRLKYKEENDPREYTVKIFLNNSYGKFGQDITKPTVIYSYQELNRGDVCISTEKNDFIVRTVREKDSCIENLKCYLCESNVNPTRVINVAIAAKVCMEARVKLHDAIFANGENFLYCDTDSVFLKDDAVGIEIDKNKLGAWKEEMEFDGIELGGAKLYNLYLKNVKVKSALAGINKKWAKDNLKPNDIITINKVLGAGSKKMVVKVKGGCVLEDVEFTLKERKLCED